MDSEQAALRVTIEQRLGRVENKLDTLVPLAAEARHPLHARGPLGVSGAAG